MCNCIPLETIEIQTNNVYVLVTYFYITKDDMQVFYILSVTFQISILIPNHELTNIL